MELNHKNCMNYYNKLGLLI